MFIGDSSPEKVLTEELRTFERVCNEEGKGGRKEKEGRRKGKREEGVNQRKNMESLSRHTSRVGHHCH